jgi:hypothetical protein
VLAGVVAALVLALRAFGKADTPGFFGPGTLLADINITPNCCWSRGLPSA